MNVVNQTDGILKMKPNDVWIARLFHRVDFNSLFAYTIHIRIYQHMFKYMHDLCSTVILWWVNIEHTPAYVFFSSFLSLSTFSFEFIHEFLHICCDCGNNWMGLSQKRKKDREIDELEISVDIPLSSKVWYCE